MNASTAASSALPLRHCYWAVPGLLLAGEHPGGATRDKTKDRLKKLLGAGIECFVDLTKPTELPRYDTLLPFHVEYARKPIKDHGLPASREQMIEILEYVGSSMRAGRPVYVHCRAGIGRTGTVVGCFLVERGLAGDGALDELNRLWQQSKRSRTWAYIPETEAQAAYVRQWQPSLEGSGGFERDPTGAAVAGVGPITATGEQRLGASTVADVQSHTAKRATGAGQAHAANQATDAGQAHAANRVTGAGQAPAAEQRTGAGQAQAATQKLASSKGSKASHSPASAYSGGGLAAAAMQARAAVEAGLAPLPPRNAAPAQPSQDSSQGRVPMPAGSGSGRPLSDSNDEMIAFEATVEQRVNELASRHAGGEPAADSRQPDFAAPSGSEPARHESRRGPVSRHPAAERARRELESLQQITERARRELDSLRSVAELDSGRPGSRPASPTAAPGTAPPRRHASADPRARPDSGPRKPRETPRRGAADPAVPDSDKASTDTPQRDTGPASREAAATRRGTKALSGDAVAPSSDTASSLILDVDGPPWSAADVHDTHEPREARDVVRGEGAGTLAAPDPMLDADTLMAARALRERFVGVLLGLAVGDAVAAATQYRRPGTFSPVGDMLGGGPFDLPRGAWSDDTAMALCLAESLLECNGFDARDQVQRYTRWQQEGYLSSTGQCVGITASTARSLAIAKWRRVVFPGSHDPEQVDPEPLSRIAPVALYYFTSMETTLERAAEASRATCQAPAVLDACRTLGGALHAALSGQSKERILAEAGPAAATPVQASNTAASALAAAAWAFASTDNFRDAILRAANVGGNSDVVAAVCGQLAGAHYGFSAIPPSWRNGLMHKELIETYADRLMAHALVCLSGAPGA